MSEHPASAQPPSAPRRPGPPGRLAVQVGGASDAGRLRLNNEDAFLWHLPTAPAEETLGPLFAVADGVGGEAAGEVASRLAVETLAREYYASASQGPDQGPRERPSERPAQALERAVGRANAAVHGSAQADHRATTLVAAAIAAGVLHVASVGDSRLYLVRGRSVTQITQDHSWVQEQVRAGYLAAADADGHPHGHVITRWLGQPAAVPDLFAVELAPGDRIVLCTDGLVRHVADATIGEVARSRPPAAAAAELVRLANAGGGSDNTTVVVVAIEAAAAEAPGEVTGEVVAPARQRLRWPRLRRRHLLWLGAALVALLGALAALGALLTLAGADGTVVLPGSPVALATAPDGALLVADQASGEVLTYAPGALATLDVRLLGRLPEPGARWPALEPGSPPGALVALTVGPDGTVLVADAARGRLRALDRQGQLLATWGSGGSGPGELGRPRGLAVDATGRVYVADAGNRRVQRFDRAGRPDGTLGETLGRLLEPTGVAVDPAGVVYVADGLSGHVLRFDPSGRLLGVWAPPDATAGERAVALAAAPAGVYVADPLARAVWRLGPAGEPEREWRGLWPSRGGFQEPVAVAADGRGALYVLDVRGGGLHVLREGPRIPR